MAVADTSRITSTTAEATDGSNDREKLIPSPKPASPRFFDKSLMTAASLSKLLPTGTTLAFQTMAPSFTKGGQCRDHDVNFVFTLGLISFLTVLSALLSFTDSVTDKHGNTYYGVATPNGFKLFNHNLKRLELAPGSKKKELRSEKKMRPRDFLHALLSATVFMALAFCDAGVQKCLVPMESGPWRDFLKNLPLAVGFLASFVLMIFPTTRKGIGDDGHGVPPPLDSSGGQKKEPVKRRLFDKSLGTAASLSKLLPTGTTLAFQTMAPSFANGGICKNHGVNFAFTWGLIGFLTLLCLVLSFTDSITDKDGNTYYGIATPKGLLLFDHHHRHERLLNLDGEKRKIIPRDFLHAAFSAAVFLTIAFCDAGVQGCLIPKESRQWREFVNLLPLAVGFLASFVFLIFPSSRHGIGEVGVWDTQEEDGKTSSASDPDAPPPATSPQGAPSIVISNGSQQQAARS